MRSVRKTYPLEQEISLSCFPYGTGQQGEGISLLVQIGEYRVLLDCGLPDIAALTSSPEPPVDIVFCSHAHKEHAIGLLALHQAYPRIPIYSSQVTLRLLSLLWPEIDVNTFCQALPWRKRVEVLKNLTLEIFPAGHIPGAAASLVTYHTARRPYKVFYTGDFSLSNFQLVEGLSIEPLRGLSPDVLILEGTYGTNRHPHRRQQEKALMERIHQALSYNQNILFLVSPLGLGQEILKLLRSHHQFTGRNLDIWVDGKVAQACDIYLELLPELPASVQNFAKHQPLFWDERISPRMYRFTPENQPQPDAFPYILLTDDITTVSSYCATTSGTWLILIPEHLKARIKTIQEEIKPFSWLTLEPYLLAEHSDGRNTTQLIHNLRPQHILFVHGSTPYLTDLASLEELQNRYQLHVPSNDNIVDLPIGEKFIQPAPPAVSLYEGELNEVGTSIIISLPSQMTSDTRWSLFADTGLVEARWQGEELIIRGLQERELLSQNTENRGIEDFDCCRNCLHYRGQKCWNSRSPLYDFKVTPEGCCPVFESLTVEQ